MAKTGSSSKARARTPSRKTRKAAASTVARRRPKPTETGGHARAGRSAEGHDVIKGQYGTSVAKQTHRDRSGTPQTRGRAAAQRT
jgi:hypothetical protein